MIQVTHGLQLQEVGDFEGQSFRLSTMFDTSQKPLFYYCFAYFLYTLLAVGVSLFRHNYIELYGDGLSLFFNIFKIRILL